ncbi:MAG: hypothetical protein DI582_05170 [Azospirillum brasilense]|nr:MAG: hypothetical protein DI582_05170 [Azospirillum brasilense]
MQTVNGHDAALVALRGGAQHLCSPAYGACHSGVGYYVALIEALQRACSQPFTFTVCCGDDAAQAHHAMVMGLKHIRYTGDHAMRPALQSMAGTLGVTLVTA